MQESAKWVILLGLIITLVGLICYFWENALSWAGRLPGDIRIERENFKFYFPLTTMILISIVINAIVRIYKYFTE
jgi:H+/Cl- antiporter ClcA